MKKSQRSWNGWKPVIMALGIVMVLLSGCHEIISELKLRKSELKQQKRDNDPPSGDCLNPDEEINGTINETDDGCKTDLVAGQVNDIGQVETTISDDTLYVRFFIDEDGFCLEEAHLDIGKSLSDLAQTPSCNPIPGKFEFKYERNGGAGCVTDYTFEIPFDGEPGDLVYIAAHADVGSESAWAEGNAFQGNNWGMYLVCEVPEPEPVKVAGVRFRSFNNTGGSEVYLGTGDLGVGANRVEKNYTWKNPGTVNFIFEYDASGGDLTVSFQDVTDGVAGAIHHLTYSIDGGTLPEMDGFEVLVADRDDGAQVDMLNLKLDGTLLSPANFNGNDGVLIEIFDDPNDLNDGFKFSGTIEISGTFSNSQELSKVEILLGRNLQ